MNWAQDMWDQAEKEATKKIAEHRIINSTSIRELKNALKLLGNTLGYNYITINDCEYIEDKELIKEWIINNEIDALLLSLDHYYHPDNKTPVLYLFDHIPFIIFFKSQEHQILFNLLEHYDIVESF